MVRTTPTNVNEAAHPASTFAPPLIKGCAKAVEVPAKSHNERGEVPQ